MGREEHYKQISLACVGSACSAWATLGLPLLTGTCAFPFYTAQAPGFSAGGVSKTGPGLCALPRSKPLRFRLSSTPQRHRLGWACILCPSQIQRAQVTRCLASELSQVDCASYHLPGPSFSLSWVHSESALSGVPFVFSSELISDCNLPGGCQPSRIPGRPG